MKDIDTINGLMVYYLQSLLDLELKWSDAIEDVLKEISSSELREIFIRSADLFRNHLRILEEILEELNEKQFFVNPVFAPAVIAELHRLLQTITDSEVKDSALLVFYQSINHFKIAQYSAVGSFSEFLGEKDIAETISHLLQEEKDGNEILSKLVETRIH